MPRRVSRHRGRYDIFTEARGILGAVGAIAVVVAIATGKLPVPARFFAVFVVGTVVLLVGGPLLVLAWVRRRSR
jgi:hypothetical protein